MFDNFQGKSRAYVEDSIGQMLTDYQEAASDHGFDLVTGTLSAITKSKSVIAAAGAALAAAILGAPVGAAIAGAAGLSLEVANIAVTLAEKRHGFAKLKRDHELAYLIDAKDVLSSHCSKRL
jgi:hypothetical protein